MFGPHSLLRSWPCQFLTTILLIAGMTVSAAPPIWWTTPDAANFRVIDPAVTDSNAFGPANVGQGKYIAKRALEALSTAVGGNTAIQTQVVAAIEQELYKTEENSPTGVFFPVVPDEPTPDWLDAQKVPLQIGAMKAMAAPFYRHLSAMNGNWVRDQLIANGLTLGSGFFQDTDGTYYPWNPADNSSTLKNRAPATIGQLKVVFSLRFEALDIDGDGTIDSADQNGDGIPDSTQDSDGDGLTDAQEYALGTDPKKVDTDDDGLTDAEELQRGTKPKNPNTDADDMKDGEDADPLDVAINWKITPEPRYAYLEINDWDPLTHGSPIMTNKRGQLLCQKAVWKDKEWTQIQGTHFGVNDTSVTLTNTYGSEPIKLYDAVATSIDDIGTIAGYATGRTWLSNSYWGSLPLVWNTATDSTPIAVGVPDTLPDYIPGDYDATAYIARNGQIMTVPHYQTNFWLQVNSMIHYDGLDPDPVRSALAPGQFGGMGRDGSSCGRTYDPYGNTEPWTWLGPEPQTYAELNSSNTTNPDPFTGNIDFNADIHTMGTTPSAGPTATAQESPAVNLGGQTLIYNGQKWVRSKSLQGASAISTSGTALTTDFSGTALTNNFAVPAVWRNGKVTKLKDLCTGLTEEGITDFNTIDINDEGVILIRVPAEIPFVDRIALLIPAAVVEVSPKLRNDGDVVIESSKYPASYPESTEMVERDPGANQDDASTVRIAWRDMKVKIGKLYTGKKVTWTMTPQFKPWVVTTAHPEGEEGANTAFRGKWGMAEDSAHRNRFSQSTSYGKQGFSTVGATQSTETGTGATVNESAKTTIDQDGYTAIRANLPPVGFNKARVTIQIEGVTGDIDLIDLENPAVIFIDPGHGFGGETGGSKDGTVGLHTGVTEGDAALDIGTRTLAEIKRIASERDLLIREYNTRSKSNPRINLGLNDREAKGRRFGSDVFVALHFDGATDHRTDKAALYRNPFGMIDQNTDYWNYNPRADWALALRIREAVQAAIASVEPASSIAATQAAYDAWDAAHPNDHAERVTSEMNEQRNQKGLGALNDGAEPGVENGNYLASGHKHLPSRTTLIEMERISNKQADELFNGNTKYTQLTGQISLTATAESMRATVATRIADACIADALIRDLAAQDEIPRRKDKNGNVIGNVNFENDNDY